MSHFSQHRPLCLASSSPRRQMFLKKFGLKFDCFSPNINEIPKLNEHAKSFVKRMANEKAQNVKQNFFELSENTIVLAGDTIVYYEGQILGKPKTTLHAKKMLSQLSGQTHKVFSGFSILDSLKSQLITKVICTEVKFQKLKTHQLEWYISTGEPFDKAGAYSIQGLGSILIESISGSYNNVVGFPIEYIFPYLTNIGCISFGGKNR